MDVHFYMVSERRNVLFIKVWDISGVVLKLICGFRKAVWTKKAL